MRYAIYFTPPEGDPLAVAAASWLGRDAIGNIPIDQDAAQGFTPEELAILTAEPRRYGFHATLKAPFELSPDIGEDELLSAFDALADNVQPVEIPSIVLGQLGSFFALVPGDACQDLQELAAECVRHFEPMRAPLSAADIGRRNPASLSSSQRHNLETWGYPYVFDDFRFHMTLTGKVPVEAQQNMRTILAERFQQFIGQPLAVRHLALFVEPERGAPFFLKKIKPLGTEREIRTA